MTPTRIQSLALTIVCSCGQAEVRITMASLLYHDAVCPHCGKKWTATIDVREQA